MGYKTTALALALLAAASPGATAANPSPLALGQQVRGEITSADLLNWRDGSRSELYAITLAADEGVRLEVAGALRAQLSVFHDGQLVQASADSRDEASLVLRASRAGRYVVAVSGADASAYGPFTLAATALRTYTGGELSPGDSISDWASEPRRIPLRIAREGVYRVRMASDDFDTVLSLEGNGLALRSDDAEGSNSMLTAQLAPGTYTLLASGYDGRIDGQYQLSVAEHALPTGVGIATGGELEVGRDITALYQGQPLEYRLRVDGRRLLELEMRSSEIDSGLRLQGNGVELENDDGGAGLDARIASVLEAGDYTVRASAYDEGAGVFTLSARLSEVPADAGGGELQLGRPRDARLMDGAADRYTITLPRAGAYRFDMSSNDGVDSHLRLFADGDEVTSDDDSGSGTWDARIDEHLPAGDYVLEASSAVGGPGGRYRIGVQRR